MLYTNMETFTDYYTLLGVETTASAAEIKAAFKKLALQYHPDVYKGPDAEERMRALLQAYQILSDQDERRLYDAHRPGQHIPHGSAMHAQAHTMSGYEGGVYRKKEAEVTPAARRDRQRRYAFPTLDDLTTTRIDLGNTSYDLPAKDARALKEQGMWRGTAPAVGGNTAQAGNAFYCHRCHHHWNATVASTPGYLQRESCPNCHARDWNEYLLLRCAHCRAVFESEQIRYEVGSYNYGGGALCPPYELFPLCPYCSASHWCPAEEARVEILRAKAARRAILVNTLLVGVALVVIILIAATALGALH